MSWKTVLGCESSLFERGGSIVNDGLVFEVIIPSYQGECFNYPGVKVIITKYSICTYTDPPALCSRDNQWRYPVDLLVTMWRKQRGRYRLLRSIELVSDVREPTSLECDPEESALPMLFETCFDDTVVDVEIDLWIDNVLSNPPGKPFAVV